MRNLFWTDVTPLDNDTCLIPSRRPNATAISNVYEGIPETIVLNVICWLLLILLFAILRNRAWDYGRLALVQTEKWTQLFYKNTEEAVAVGESSSDISLVPETGCLWFPSFFKISKQKLYSRCGSDAVHYISFQEQLLILFAIITVFSLCVILPINFQGKLQGGKTTFGHTTVSNLEPSSPWLWVHVFAAFALVPLTVLIMRRSSGRVPSSTNLTSRTLMITHISHPHRNADDIKNYFTVRYPGVEVKHVQVAYRVKKLMALEKRREAAHEAKMNCVSRPEITVRAGGCCACRTANGLEYYTGEEARLTQLVRIERRKALSSPLGVAFVTVGGEDQAEYVISSFQPGSLRHWLMSKAPSPGDINWENLEISYRNWYSKLIFINVILFFFLFFLTTPVIVVNWFNTITSTKSGDYIKKVSPLLADFLPTLIMLMLSALMPVLVSKSDVWLSHWTKSKQNHATMHKSFFYLLFIFLILPSLGLTSAQAFLEWSIQKNASLHWECVFLADKGAFFVNYVITSSLIGTALELLRFPELAMYALRLVTIKSEAEKSMIRKEILSEFPFGIHYAWTLLIFSISAVYSFTCPLITPFGLLYLSLKHLVDKYNIYYVYKPIEMCGEGQQIHSDSVKMVRVAIFLLQLIMAAFSFVRGGLNTMTLVTFLGCAFTICFFFFLGPFPACKPVKNRNLPHNSNEQYIAPVLLSSQSLDEEDEDAESVGSGGMASPTYGSNQGDVGVWMCSESGVSNA